MHKFLISNLRRKRQGFSLIEIILAMAIMTISIGAVFVLQVTNSSGVATSFNQEQATAYAKEALAIIENIQDDNFLLLQDNTYILSETDGEYSLVSGANQAVGDIYQRSIQVEPVYRDGANEITENGNNLDNSTKKVTVTVSWMNQFGRFNSVVIQEYFSDWEGTIWTQTTETQFNNGSLTDVIVTSSNPVIPDNGLIQLAENVGESLTYFDTVDVLERAKDVAFNNNYVYGAVAKANQGICSVDFSTPDDPTVDDCLDINGHGQAIAISGDYAFMAVSSNNKALAVVDISDPSNLSLAATLNLGDTANDIEILDNHAYIALNDDDSGLTIVNISNPEAPFITAVADTDANALSVSVAGNYAYIGNDDEELIIFDVSNTNSPVLESTLVMANDVMGSAYDNGYLFAAVKSTSSALQVVSVSDPSAPVIVDTLSATGTANDAEIMDGILYVSIDDNAAGLRTYDITNPLAASFIKAIDIQGKGSGIDASASYIFVATDTQNQGLAMVTTGELTISPTGTYESQIYDSGNESTNYQSISWLSTIPSGTSVTLQIRTADSLENIATADYVGINGTTDSYYTSTPSIISLDPARTGKRFLQWRVIMTSDGNSSPVVEEVTIKYD